MSPIDSSEIQVPMLTRSGRPRRAITAAIAGLSSLSPPPPSPLLPAEMDAIKPVIPPTQSADIARAGSSKSIPKRTKRTSESLKIDTPKLKKPRIPKISPPSPGPFRELIPLHTAPALLPATLPFCLTTAISHLGTHDPRFSILHSHIPPKPFAPPLEAVDPFRTLVTSIIGQQVSWLAAKAITGRFRRIWGFEGEEGFPTPLEVSKGTVESYRGAGFSQRKAEYVIAIAEHFVSGQISTELLQQGTDEDIGKALIAVRGIGQWTTDMFLMFSLRRPDILPVGDLGVQKGLLKWALAAHGHLPTKVLKSGKKAEANRAKYKKGTAVKVEEQEVSVKVERGTREMTPPQRVDEGQKGFPATPYTPGNEADRTFVTPGPSIDAGPSGGLKQLPPTPLSPGTINIPISNAAVNGEVKAETLVKIEESPLTTEAEVMVEAGAEVVSPGVMMVPPVDHPSWDAHKAAPLEEGLSIELLKSRLSGKKAKGGAYLTPREMEVLTEGWRPYRSVGVYYMWPAGEDY